MTTPPLRIGCQTFTWEMLGPRWAGTPDDLVQAIADAGYAGIEITDTMIGDYATRPAAFARRLGDAGLSLVAFAFGSPGGFTEPDHRTLDLEAARAWIDFAAFFPNAVVSMGSATLLTEGPKPAKLATAATIYNQAAAIGRSLGVTVAVHPSSHHGTLLHTRADYDRLFALLDPEVGWVPDTGHILRGGQSLPDTLAAHRGRICYLHLKDVDAAGDWAMLGAGVCDIPSTVAAVGSGPRFNGWIVAEEESDVAAADPATAVHSNRATLRNLLGL